MKINTWAFNNSMIFVAITGFIFSLHCGDNFTTALGGNILLGAFVAPIIYKWLDTGEPEEKDIADEE